MAKKTKIDLKYLEALENDDFTKLPEAAFVKGFIQNYAKAVGLNPQQALAVFRRDYDQDMTGQVVPRGLTHQEFEKRKLWTPKTTMIVGLGMLLAAFSIYFVYQYRLLAAAPPLEIETPREQERVRQSVTVTGKTDPQATLTINNQQVPVDSDGSFSQSIVLPEGTRTITIISTNRSGKSRTVQRTINVEP